MRRYVRMSLTHAQNINVVDVALLYSVSVDDVHVVCSNLVLPPVAGRTKRQYQRLRNTADIDYYPIGDYGYCHRLPSADGRKNPFRDRLVGNRHESN